MFAWNAFKTARLTYRHIHKHVDHLQKRKKEYKKLEKQEIHIIFIRTNYIKPVFNMAWLMEILMI